jgi:alanine racemase
VGVVRPSYVEIDLTAIRHNAAEIRRTVAPARLCAVVKADGYGHGDVPVAEAALAGGADWLAVALVEEGARLREAGIDAPILVLGETVPEDAPEIVQWKLIPTVYSEGFLDVLERAAGDDPLRVHLKLDTGMHRVGVAAAGARLLAKRIAASNRLHLHGLWTHFAVAEEDAAFTRRQLAELESFRDELAATGINVPVVHAANTAGALAFPEARLDMVRTGIGVYGLRPASHIGVDLDLRPALQVRSRVATVKRLPAGARPSYGRRRPLERESTVVSVPLGYADGVHRRLGEAGGEVLIGGKRFAFAGTVTMDHIIIDVGDEAVEAGDDVVILGRQGGEEISAEEWAQRLGTINYEILCDFGPRLPRRYRS